MACGCCEIFHSANAACTRYSGSSFCNAFSSMGTAAAAAGPNRPNARAAKRRNGANGL